jgi:YidC/Oxa1 family membrane protein insertase
MKFSYGLCGNYGLALLLFTIVVKIVMIPSDIKRRKQSIRQAAFQPVINEIKERYADDKQRMQDELVRVQTEHDFTMGGGCLSLLVQMPIFMGLIRVIYRPLTYILSFSKESIDAAIEFMKDAGMAVTPESPQISVIEAIKDGTASFGDIFTQAEISAIMDLDMTFFGIDLTKVPSIKEPSVLWLIPIMSIATILFSSFILPLLKRQKLQKAAMGLTGYITIMFLYLGFVLPAGVTRYWCYSNIVGNIVSTFLAKVIKSNKEYEKVKESVEAARRSIQRKNVSISSVTEVSKDKVIDVEDFKEVE